MSNDPLLWEPYDRHWIRLRGPWELTCLTLSLSERGSDEDVPRRIRLPADWCELFGERSGTARFSRRFQLPTNLDVAERVLVTLCEVRCDVTAMVNNSMLTPLDAPLGDPASLPCEDPLSFEITPFLQPTNLLTLDVTVTDAVKDGRACGLWRPVFLEIITPE